MAIGLAAWSSTAALNISVNGVDIAEGCAPAGLNNAIRYVMADVKDFYNIALRVGENVYILADGATDPLTPVDGDIVINYTP